MDQTSTQQPGLLQQLDPATSAGRQEQGLRQTSPDGSTPFTDIDSSFLAQHLSAPELSILSSHLADGKDFSYLTELEVANLFL